MSAVAVFALLSCSGPGFLSGLDRLSGGGAGVGRVASSIDYGSHGQKLDIYRPDDAGNALLPVVIFVHGGSWRDGTRGGYAFVGRSLARQGFIGLVIDYRKLPEHKFPDFHYDVAEAVRWAVDNVEDYGGSADNIFVAGHSAGAHIAMLAALDPRYLKSVGLDQSAIAGIIGIAGPYDFYPFTVEAARAAFAGADPALTQPVNFARADAPPILLLHGLDDETVLPKNSESLAAAIEKAGGEAELALYPGVGHVGAITSLSPLLGGKDEIMSDMARFIRDRRREPAS